MNNSLFNEVSLNECQMNIIDDSTAVQKQNTKKKNATVVTKSLVAIPIAVAMATQSQKPQPVGWLLQLVLHLLPSFI